MTAAENEQRCRAGCVGQRLDRRARVLGYVKLGLVSIGLFRDQAPAGAQARFVQEHVVQQDLDRDPAHDDHHAKSTA